MAPAQLAGVTSCFVCEFAATSKLMQALHPQKHHDQYPGTHQTSGSVQACTSAVHVSTTKRRDDTISTDETVASQDVYWASEAALLTSASHQALYLQQASMRHCCVDDDIN